MIVQALATRALVATTFLLAGLNISGCALAEYVIADQDYQSCTETYGESSSECWSSEADMERLESDSDENLGNMGELLEDLEDELNE